MSPAAAAILQNMPTSPDEQARMNAMPAPEDAATQAIRQMMAAKAAAAADLPNRASVPGAQGVTDDQYSQLSPAAQGMINTWYSGPHGNPMAGYTPQQPNIDQLPNPHWNAFPGDATGGGVPQASGQAPPDQMVAGPAGGYLKQSDLAGMNDPANADKQVASDLDAANAIRQSHDMPLLTSADMNPANSGQQLADTRLKSEGYGPGAVNDVNGGNHFSQMAPPPGRQMETPAHQALREAIAAGDVATVQKDPTATAANMRTVMANAQSSAQTAGNQQNVVALAKENALARRLRDGGQTQLIANAMTNQGGQAGGGGAAGGGGFNPFVATALGPNFAENAATGARLGIAQGQVAADQTRAGAEARRSDQEVKGMEFGQSPMGLIAKLQAANLPIPAGLAMAGKAQADRLYPTGAGGPDPSYLASQIPAGTDPHDIIGRIASSNPSPDALAAWTHALINSGKISLQQLEMLNEEYNPTTPLGIVGSAVGRSAESNASAQIREQNRQIVDGMIASARGQTPSKPGGLPPIGGPAPSMRPATSGFIQMGGGLGGM